MEKEKECRFIIKARSKNSVFSGYSKDRKCIREAKLNGYCTIHAKMIQHDTLQNANKVNEK